VGEASILAALEIVHDGKGVQVEFTKIDGLISHTICLVNPDEKTPVLVSRINELAQPCFTELHQQGDMLFLTGANGAGHWSMSVQKGDRTFAGVSNPSQSKANSSGQFLHFDIACRLKEPYPYLCNQYVAKESFGCSRTIWACSTMNAFDMARGMVLLGGPMENNVFSPAPHYSMDCVSEHEIRFSPKDATVASFPTTMRWSYGVWRI